MGRQAGLEGHIGTRWFGIRIELALLAWFQLSHAITHAS